MAINILYVPLFTLEEVFLDKDTGLPLAGGIVTFYRDAQRTTPKVVYQISGTYPTYTFTSIGNTLVLGLSGTFVDGTGEPIVPYAFPYDAAGDLDLYYVTVESAGNVAQFVRQAVPYVNTSTTPPAERTNTENELSNPQFVEVDFPSDVAVTLTVTGSNTVTKVAPNWDLITSGSGTVALQRVEPTAANVPTNPPYTLSINASAGLGATVTLRQRLLNSPSLLRGGFASGSFVAAVIGGGASNISMLYVPSTGSSTTIIPSTTVSTDGAYHQIANNAPIPDQVNSAASVGYVDIIILIPTSRTIAISSIQVVGTSYSIDIPFDEQSAGRQKDHLFHYYQDAVVRQPKANLLTGWTFGLNPWQFRAPASANVAANQYTADQTIIIQQEYVTSATANNVAVGRASHTADYAFQITAVSATNKIAMLQYIDPSTIRPFWGETLSVRFRASVTVTAPNVTVPTFKVRLLYKAGLPSSISQTVPVSAWTNASNSIPTVSGDGWTYLSATNDPTYSLSGTMQDFNFNGFVLPASSSADMTLGVMFIMMDPLVETGTPDVINIERVSLVKNEFSIDADPETWDESLRKCQFYYEKSWAQGTATGTDTLDNIKFASMIIDNNDLGTTKVFPASFAIEYATTKRTVPTTDTLTVYAKDGTVDAVYVVMNKDNTNVISPVNAGFSANWLINGTPPLGGSISKDRAFCRAKTNTTALITNGAGVRGEEGFGLYHYTVDTRLGN